MDDGPAERRVRCVQEASAKNSSDGRLRTYLRVNSSSSDADYEITKDYTWVRAWNMRGVQKYKCLVQQWISGRLRQWNKVAMSTRTFFEVGAGQT
jgi:hypothetical protein